MHQLYYEQRKLPSNPVLTPGADIARHMQTRQYLGTTVIVCENPHSMLSATRKLWLKGARYLQKLRASTLNAEEILRLTHAIMHMQNLLFVAKSPLDCPDAGVFFIKPGQLAAAPHNCFTVYVTVPISRPTVRVLQNKLPTDCLIVDYTKTLDFAGLGIHPKASLEQRMSDEWERMAGYLQRHGVNVDTLVAGPNLQYGAMDNALDILLGGSNDFLRQAATLQRTVNLAQPLTHITAERQKQLEAITRLAHRVQALSPGTFNSYLLTTFGDSQAMTFFMRDVGLEFLARRAVLFMTT